MMLVRRLAGWLAAALVGGICAAGPPAPSLLAQEAAPGETLPLEPTRSLRFTTDEGTWLSLDVSPDGSTVVFDLLGDLYTLPLTGGRATRITNGQGFDGQPRYSPDGRRIVFVSDRDGSDNLWIADSDGSNPRPLTDTEWYGYISPEWTPDGDYVVATRRPGPKERGEPHHLYQYHVAGGSGLRLTGHVELAVPPAPTDFVGAAFGPDARWIWAAASRGGGWGEWQLVELDRETGRSYVRTNELQSAMRPVVSPDGRWLVYATRDEAAGVLKLRDLETGEERVLVAEAQRDDQEGRWSRDLAPGSSFTPDSRYLVTSYGGRIMKVEITSGTAEPIPFTAEVDQRIGPLALFDAEASPDTVRARFIQRPQVAPGGERVAFSALGRLWVAELATGADRAGPPRRVTDQEAHNEHSPAWSPDGRWLAWVSWEDGVGGHLWRAPADGSGTPERLTSTPAYFDRLAWSPDGERILAVRAPARERVDFYDELNRGQLVGTDLVWIPAAGGDPAVVTPIRPTTRYTPDYYGAPHFGPDPERIFLHDPSEGLVSVRWDGTDRRVHLRVEAWDWPLGADFGATEILMSPDGDRAAALVNQNLWLLEVPPAGGEPPLVSFPPGEGAPVPARRLSRSGADFPHWSPDGAHLHWSLGPALFSYDLAAGDAALRDSLRAEAAGAPEAAGYRPDRTDVWLTVPAQKHTGLVALRGARIVTMVGDQVIEDGTLLVDGERIAAVGPTGEVDVPAGARVLDASGTTILPGYVDVHAHMWTPWGVQRQQPWEYRINLAYGVTTTRDPQTMTPDVFGYADRVAAGQVLGPRVFATGRGIHASEEIGSLDHARDVVRRYSEFWQSGTIKQYLVGDRKVRQWIAMAAAEQGVSPTTEGGSDFKMNLTLMLDGYAGLEHSLPVWPLYRDVQELVRQSGIVYTPTLIVSYGGPSMLDYFLQRERIEENERLALFMPEAEILAEGLRRNRWVREDQWGFPAVAREAARLARAGGRGGGGAPPRLARAGGRVGMGSHGNLQGLGAHWELWAFAMGGMRPLEVLRAATLTGAEAIGMEDELGSLEPGKLADFQVLEGNPLQDIRETDSIRWVVLGGRVLDARTLEEVDGG